MILSQCDECKRYTPLRLSAYKGDQFVWLCRKCFDAQKAEAAKKQEGNQKHARSAT